MISTQDLYKELKVIEDVIGKEKDEFNKASLKSLTLVIKLLHNLRTNMVQIMTHFKIERLKPKETKDEE